MYACMGRPHLCVNSCCAVASNYSDKALLNKIQVFFSFFPFIFSNGGCLVGNLIPHSNCLYQ